MTRFLAILASGLLTFACAAYDYTYKRNDAMFDRIQPGLTQAQVREITGPPDNTMPFPRSGTTSWGYYYWDQFGYYVEFSVTFSPEGIVLSKAYRRVSDGNSKN